MTTPLPLSPFITLKTPTCIADVLENLRFELFPDDFLAVEPDEPAPLFIRDPSPEYMSARDLMPIVKVIAGRAA